MNLAMYLFLFLFLFGLGNQLLEDRWMALLINWAINLLTLITIPSWKCAALDIEVEMDGVRHRK